MFCREGHIHKVRTLLAGNFFFLGVVNGLPSVTFCYTHVTSPLQVQEKRPNVRRYFDE